jgi:hypothetical protein
LLGIGVAFPLVAIGGYVVWLAQRVDEIEERAGEGRTDGPARRGEGPAD